MSKLFYKITIEDIEEKNCSEQEIDILLDILKQTIKNTACTLAYKAYFKLQDFSRARQYKLNHFSLILKKHIINEQEQWWAEFSMDGKKLNVIATLNKN